MAFNRATRGRLLAALFLGDLGGSPNVNLEPNESGSSGAVRVNGKGFVPVSYRWDAVDLAVDSMFFVAAGIQTYRVTGIIARVEVAGTDAGAVTAVVKKAASGTAITAGTALHTGTINLKGTVATNQALTLEAAANLLIAAGDTIGFDFTGVSTAAVGCLTVMLEPMG